jgi:hypothetical protein
MDDLSQRAIKLVIEYCLGILDESKKKSVERFLLLGSKTPSPPCGPQKNRDD